MSPPPLCLPTMLASACMSCTSNLSLRPPQGKAVSHRRQSLPRAGSPTYWVPRLVVPPSGPELHTGNAPLLASPILKSNPTLEDNLSPCVSCQGPYTLRAYKSLSLPPPGTHVQEGETPWASRTFAHAKAGHTLALSSSPQRSRCRLYTPMACTQASTLDNMTSSG